MDGWMRQRQRMGDATVGHEADSKESLVESIEINFQLDAEGRTSIQRISTGANPPTAAADGRDDVVPDYSTRIYATQFTSDDDKSAKVIDPSTSQLYRELLMDCDIADSGLMPRTFWVPSTLQHPRCTLEHMAKDIFDFYVRNNGVDYNPATSGAEWWVQIRPSPETTGRYSMHAPDVGGSSVHLHWDKDEELRILCGGSTYVHPHWSTVTYLSSVGAPTLVAEGRRVNNLTGEWIVPEEDTDDENNNVILSWPSQGKHLCFDGRLLHGAPGDLAAEQGTAECRRYTFLVNIWLNHRPLQVEPFPSCMLSKLSGHDGSAKESCRPRIRLALAQNVTEIPTAENDVQQGDGNQDRSSGSHSKTSYAWPMGNDGDGSLATMVTARPVMELLEQHGTTIRLCTRQGLVLRKEAALTAEGAKKRKLAGDDETSR